MKDSKITRQENEGAEREKRTGYSIASRDGLKLFIQRFGSPLPLKARVVCLPGIGNYGWYFEPLATFLSSRGFELHAVDPRGTGLSGGARWDIPSLDAWKEDVSCAVEHVAGMHPAAPVVLLGHSLGGSLGIQVAADRRASALLKSFIAISPAMTVDIGSFPVQNYFLFPLGMVMNSRLIIKVPFPSAAEMIANNADPALAERLSREPYILKRMSTRAALAVDGTRKLPLALKAAASTTLPVQVICGESDSAIRGARAYYENLASGDNSFVPLPGRHHHMLRLPEDSELYESIAAWLIRHCE